MAQQDPALSVVVPMFNEESVLPLFAERLRAVLDELGETYEVVAVDDGSTDATAAALRGMRERWPQLRVIRLRRNGGTLEQYKHPCLIGDHAFHQEARKAGALLVAE